MTLQENSSYLEVQSRPRLCFIHSLHVLSRLDGKKYLTSSSDFGDKFDPEDRQELTGLVEQMNMYL